MEYWWKENKAFVVPIGAMLLAVLLWHWLFLSPLRVDAAKVQRERQLAEQKLRVKMASGVPSEDAVTRGKRDLERSKKVLDDLRKELQLARPESYPAGKFVTFKEDIRKKIVDKGSGVGLPDNVLGFPQMDDLSPELSDELLGRLAIVEKLALGAIECGVQRIESVNPIVGMNVDSAEPTLRKDACLNRLSVRMRVIGSSNAVFQWLWRVQKKNDFLAVDDFRTEKTSPHEDIFAAEMEVSGLLINLAGGLAPAKE